MKLLSTQTHACLMYAKTLRLIFNAILRKTHISFTHTYKLFNGEEQKEKGFVKNCVS